MSCFRRTCFLLTLKKRPMPWSQWIALVIGKLEFPYWTDLFFKNTNNLFNSQVLSQEIYDNTFVEYGKMVLKDPSFNGHKLLQLFLSWTKLISKSWSLFKCLAHFQFLSSPQCNLFNISWLTIGFLLHLMGENNC